MKSSSEKIQEDKPVLVVLAAGLGSRFGGLKQIKPVDDYGHVLMDYAIFDAVKAGFGEVVFIIRKEFEEEFKTAVGNRISERVPVSYVYQSLDELPEGCEVPEGREKPWGTTHALWCCREVLKGKKFVTINADDYYGKNALKNAYNFLSAEGEDNEHALIGYNIIDTLTDNGTVSRGVCVVDENDMLIRIDERKEIKKEAERGYYTLDGGVTYYLIPREAVASMNMWVFRSGFMDDISENFEKRLINGINEKPLKFEETISDAVQNMLEREVCTVKVLNSDSEWFGMTYQEDYEAVKDRLKKLTDEGIYPEGDW